MGASLLAVAKSIYYSQNLYQKQRVLRRSIYIELVRTFSEECNVYADLLFRACLHGGGGPQVGDVTCLGGVKK